MPWTWKLVVKLGRVFEAVLTSHWNQKSSIQVHLWSIKKFSPQTAKHKQNGPKLLIICPFNVHAYITNVWLSKSWNLNLCLTFSRWNMSRRLTVFQSSWILRCPNVLVEGDDGGAILLQVLLKYWRCFYNKWQITCRPHHLLKSPSLHSISAVLKEAFSSSYRKLNISQVSFLFLIPRC